MNILRSCTRMDVCVCLMIFMCFVQVFADNESSVQKRRELQNRNPSPSDLPPNDPDAPRVIVVYPADGCVLDTGSNQIELQSGDARHVAMEEFQRRISRLMNNQHEMRGAEDASEAAQPLRTRYLSAIQMEVTEVPDGLTEEQILKVAENLPCVDYVERDGLKFADSIDKRDFFDQGLRRLKSATPNDPFFTRQWALQDDRNWGVSAQKAWDSWTGSDDLVVAVIDSGCDLNHPDLEGKLWVNTGELNCDNGIDDDGNGYVDDCFGYDWVDNDNNPSPRGSGHGTGAAGIIGANGNNGVGITGICWKCKLMCLRFISGSEGKISNQVSAIDYAARMGAKISNNSYGGYGFSQMEFDAIKRARSLGHLFVSSAGNSDLNTDLPQNHHTPSAYPLDNILCIGASVDYGEKASFSNYGPTTVDAFAPGMSIQTIEDGGRYTIVSGTSFAAPIGAGAAALVWSKYPELSYLQIKEAIIHSCKPNSRLTSLALCGGVVDIAKALDEASRMEATNSTIIPVEDSPAAPVVQIPAVDSPLDNSGFPTNSLLSGVSRLFRVPPRSGLSYAFEEAEAVRVEEKGPLPRIPLASAIPKMSFFATRTEEAGAVL